MENRETGGFLTNLRLLSRQEAIYIGSSGFKKEFFEFVIFIELHSQYMCVPEELYFEKSYLVFLDLVLKQSHPAITGGQLGELFGAELAVSGFRGFAGKHGANTIGLVVIEEILEPGHSIFIIGP